MAQEREKTITKTRVKKEYGFTDELIAKLLPEPILVENPHYRKAAPMQLFYLKDVIKATKRKAFINHKENENNSDRKQAAQKAVETKKKNLEAEVNEALDKITIPKMDFEELREKAITRKLDQIEERNELRGRTYWDWDWNGGFFPDEEDVLRWIVNMLRHEYTDYESIIDTLEGKVGTNEAYEQLKRGILLKIADVYPELKDECMKQYNYVYSKKRDRNMYYSFNFGCKRVV